MGKTLYEKVWEAHEVRKLKSGQSQLFIDLHLLHEVTSPQAFGMLRDLGLKVRYPHRTFATVDHIVPTHDRTEPFQDPLAQSMLEALRQNTKEHGVTFFDLGSGNQGIVHVIGPQLGLTQPGMTIACGDSHTSTHGAFGAVAFGIGTSQVRDVLATQTLAAQKLKVRRINIEGKLAPGVYAKDVILHIIRHLGVKGGLGYAYEYGGSTVEAMDMESRMTLCNIPLRAGPASATSTPTRPPSPTWRAAPIAPRGRSGRRPKSAGGPSPPTPTPGTMTWSPSGRRKSPPRSPGASTPGRPYP